MPTPYPMWKAPYEPITRGSKVSGSSRAQRAYPERDCREEIHAHRDGRRERDGNEPRREQREGDDHDDERGRREAAEPEDAAMLASHRDLPATVVEVLPEDVQDSPRGTYATRMRGSSTTLWPARRNLRLSSSSWLRTKRSS